MNLEQELYAAFYFALFDNKKYYNNNISFHFVIDYNT